MKCRIWCRLWCRVGWPTRPRRHHWDIGHGVNNIYCRHCPATYPGTNPQQRDEAER